MERLVNVIQKGVSMRRLSRWCGRALLLVLSVASVVSFLSGCGDSGANSNESGSYDYVELGGNKWMKKNLDIATADSWCYGEGGQEVVDWGYEEGSGVYRELSSSEIQANCNKYGRLYTWASAKKACQSIGWRLPDTADWNKLVAAAGGRETAGKKLKSVRGWNSYKGIVNTNETGFSALPGGARCHSDSCYYDAGDYGYWWTATEDEEGDGAKLWVMGYKIDYIYRDGFYKTNGLSVRCVKDD